MIEAEWNACTDSEPMLEFLRDKATDRKLRLFAVACCRLFWESFTYARSRRAVEAAEHHADSVLSEEERASAQRASIIRVRSGKYTAGAAIREAPIWALSREAMLSAEGVLSRTVFALGESRGHVCKLLRCIFGPLHFRAVNADPTWLSPTVTSLAQASYDERAFERLPILADALEDAGCTNQDILTHCRQPGEHYRGCWVIDLLLAKK